MKFPEAFLSDMTEAYEYWASAQLAAGKPICQLEQWVLAVLRPTVYGLLGEKRTNGEGKES